MSDLGLRVRRDERSRRVIARPMTDAAVAEPADLVQPRAPRRRRRRAPPRPTEGQPALPGAAAPARRAARGAARPTCPGAVVVTGNDRSSPRAPRSPSSAGRTRPRAIGGQFTRGARRAGRPPAGDHRRRRRVRPRRRLRAGPGLRLPHRLRHRPVRPARDPARHHPRAAAAPSGWPAWSARPRAKDLIFTGRQVRADEALAIGPGRRGRAGGRAARPSAIERAAELAGGAVVAQALAKQAIDVGPRRHARRRARSSSRSCSSRCSAPRTR